VPPRLEGAAANFDADGVVNAARSLEEIGHTGRFGSHEAAWVELSVETEKLLSVLRAYAI
jgi:hypothetical protein